MWASPLHPSPPPWPPKTTTIKPPNRQLMRLPLTIISAAEPSKPVGNLGQLVLTAVGSSDHQQQHQKKSKSGDRQQQELSGADVLRALRKAKAKSTSAKATRRAQKSKRETAGNRKDEDEDGVDYGSVRALSIKSDWGSRIDELERRLQELMEG